MAEQTSASRPSSRNALITYCSLKQIHNMMLSASAALTCCVPRYRHWESQERAGGGDGLVILEITCKEECVGE